MTKTTAAAEKKQLADEQRKMKTVLSGMSDAELRIHVNAVLPALDAFTRRRVESADPRTNAILSSLIYQRVSRAAVKT